MIKADKPYSQACDENKIPISGVLTEYLGGAESLLEVGSGTGQHAVYFAALFPHLIWQTSDVRENLPGIRLWIAESGLANLPPPLVLDVTGPWPDTRVDAVFSANSAHIMSDSEVLAMLSGVSLLLAPGGHFALYGPFNYAGAFSSESNARFDGWLKARDPRIGIKDFERVDAFARQGGLSLIRDHKMPANNRTLVWQRER